MQYLYKNHSSEFIIEPTKYSKYYQLIIDKALNEQRIKLKKDHLDYIYYENHHILPKSLFPEFSKLKDNPWNSVLLTAREHFLVHALIWKHFKSLNHPFVHRMARAILICNNTKNFSHCKLSKIYENSKLNITFSYEHRLKLSKAKKSRTIPPQTEKTKALKSSLCRTKVKISINGVIYDSYSEASRILGIHRDTLHYRINSNSSQFNEWIKL